MAAESCWEFISPPCIPEESACGKLHSPSMLTEGRNGKTTSEHSVPRKAWKVTVSRIQHTIYVIQFYKAGKMFKEWVSHCHTPTKCLWPSRDHVWCVRACVALTANKLKETVSTSQLRVLFIFQLPLHLSTKRHSSCSWMKQGIINRHNDLEVSLW